MIAFYPATSDPRIASVRIRCLNVVRAIRSLGRDCELFDPRRSDQYRVVVFGKHLNAAAVDQAKALRYQGVATVFDLCDNYLQPEILPENLARQSKAARDLASTVDQVVVASPAMAEVVHTVLPAVAVEVIGDAVETPADLPRSSWFTAWLAQRALSRLATWIRSDRSQRRLVWFGSRGGAGGGGLADLARCRPILDALAQSHPFSLTVISNDRHGFDAAFAGSPFATHYLAWRPDTFLAALAMHHITLIPITLNPFTRCKSNNRLTQALAAGLAVVADAIPSYQPFAEVAAIGDLAGGLRTYLENPDLAETAAQQGAALTKSCWSGPSIAHQWLTMTDALIARGATHA